MFENQFHYLENFGRCIQKYSTLFFKGGMIEVALVEYFTSGNPRVLIDLEDLGCPTFNAIFENRAFQSETYDYQTVPVCDRHSPRSYKIHCSAAEVYAFGWWLKLSSIEKNNTGLIRFYRPFPKSHHSIALYPTARK